MEKHLLQHVQPEYHKAAGKLRGKRQELQKLRHEATTSSTFISTALKDTLGAKDAARGPVGPVVGLQTI